MYELFVIVAAALGAARWLKQDAHRRDHDPHSQLRSDELQFLEDDRNGMHEKTVNNTRKR